MAPYYETSRVSLEGDKDTYKVGPQLEPGKKVVVFKARGTLIEVEIRDDDHAVVRAENDGL